MALDRAKRFWEDYAPYYTKLCLSPVHKQFTADTLKAISIQKGERILDLGCGPGHFTKLLSKEGGRVCAVDYSDAMMRKAREVLSQRHMQDKEDEVKLIRSDVQKYLKTVPNDSFDVVLTSLLVSYLEKPESAIVEIFRVLRPGGRFIMSNPMPNPPFSRVFWKSGWTALRYIFYAIQLLRYAEEIKQIERAGLFHFFTIQETRELLVRAGFEQQSITTTLSLANTVYLTFAQKPVCPA